MECQCENPGYCPFFKRQIIGRLWQICNDEVLTKDQTNKYKELWLKQAESQPDQPNESPKENGCGCNKSNMTPKLY